MASTSLVIAPDDTGPLLRLSLIRHGIPTDDVFEVIEDLTGERYFAVATPIADEMGFREAYFRIFTALGDETFAALPFLRLHTIAISHEELLSIRRGLKKNAAETILPNLLQLGEVIVRPTVDPKAVIKPGFLVVSRLTSGAFEARFNSMDRHLGGKKRTFESLESVKEFLESLGVEPPEGLTKLVPSHSTPIMIGTSLAKLYHQDLI